MKRFKLFFLAFVTCIIATGQMPESFNYQVIVRNAAGEVVVKKPVSCRFSILIGSASGTVVYSEKHGVITDQFGLISIAIGNGTEKMGNLSTIDWSADSYFLKVEIDTTGGTSYTEIGTTQLLSVPYVSKSKKSASPLNEDELFIIRKYIGSFIDYRHTGPETYGGPNLIWIKTSMDNTYGKISAYGKKCEFSVGDNLYLKRTYYFPGGVSGYWVYQIENDSSVYYQVSDFQHDRNVLVETWF